MREKRISQIQKQYRFDEVNNTYLIDVSLDDYDDVYDVWDPAPFKKRFIEAEFDDFIVTSAEDIPSEYKLNIVLYIPEQKKDTNKEIAVESAYKNYYSYAVEKIARSRIKLRKKYILYFFLATLFLSAGYFFQYGKENVIIKVINEGIFIGGWVFLWEFFTNVFMTRRELNTKYRLYRRIYLSEILFVYL